MTRLTPECLVIVFAPGADGLGVDQRALVEYRYRVVLEVLGGSPIGEVAVRYGTSWPSLHRWR
jgi:hypothetical protein